MICEHEQVDPIDCGCHGICKLCGQFVGPVEAKHHEAAKAFVLAVMKEKGLIKDDEDC